MISCEEYEENKSRYSRNTTDMVAVKNPDPTSTNKNILVSKSEFSNGNYVSCCSGTISVRMRQDPSKFDRVTVEEYHSHPELYMNQAEGVVYAKFISSGENVTVTTDEYRNNKDIYCLRANTKSWVYDFSTRDFLLTLPTEKLESQLNRQSMIISIIDHTSDKKYLVSASKVNTECATLCIPSITKMKPTEYTITKIKKPTLEDFRAYQDFWESINSHSSS
jgi:hypothetical protein